MDEHVRACTDQNCLELKLMSSSFLQTSYDFHFAENRVNSFSACVIDAYIDVDIHSLSVTKQYSDRYELLTYGECFDEIDLPAVDCLQTEYFPLG